MQKIFLATMIMALSACGQAFLNETSGAQIVPFTASYDTLEGGVELRWSVNWDVTSYEVLRGDTEDSLQVYVKDLVQTNWVDVEAVPGQEYVYSLRVYNQRRVQVGEALPQRGYRSYQDYATMDAPSALKAEDKVSADRITLEWAGQDISRFRIYRSDSENGTYTLMAEVGKTTFVDTNVAPGEEWYYKVSSVGKDHTVVSSLPAASVKERFYNGVDKAGRTSTESGLAVVGRTSEAPVGVKATTTADSIALQGAILVTWNYDPLVEFARIYRSTTLDGTPELVAPYSRSSTNINGTQYSSFIDRSISVEGKSNTTVSPARWEYPTYYYWVTTIKNGEESALSAVAAGNAINPKDIIAPPDNFQATLRSSTNTNFYPAKAFPLVSSSGDYELTLSWSPLSSSISDSYGFFIISSNTVTGKTNLLNAVVLPSTATSYIVPDPEFGDEYRYMIYTANITKGGIKGVESSILYKSSTPKPPIFDDASKLRRVVTTNEISTNAPTHTYYSTLLSGSYSFRNVGAVSKVWITSSKVGDIELKLTPRAVDSQTSYNIYRRKSSSKQYVPWTLLTNVEHTISVDNPLEIVQQVFYDTNFTADEYKGSGGTSVETFYPIWEYAVSAVNGTRESALSSATKQGQAIDPADILPAPSYLSVPFHYAHGTGISGLSGWWKVMAGTPSTTGLAKIVGKGGSTTEYQKMYLTWGEVQVPGHTAGTTFDYDVRHSKAGKDYSIPTEWYHHGGINGNTFIKLDNQEDGEAKTGLYTIVDSGWGVAFVGTTYSPESAAFAVSATNSKAFGLDGETIGIFYEEPPDNPYGSVLPATTGIATSLSATDYPYQMTFVWNAVDKAAGYQVLVATDSDIYTGFGQTLTNYSRVDGALANPITSTGRNYKYLPEQEFILGKKYYYAVIAISADGAFGEPAYATYTHRRVYKPTISSLSTNKIVYTTNYTTGLSNVTAVSNTLFTDNGREFAALNRKLGTVVRMWEVVAEGNRVQLDIFYERLTTLPSSYTLYRGTSTAGPWTKISVPVPSTPMGKTNYIDVVPSAGKYYYKIAGVYDKIEGFTNDSAELVGVALDNTKLSAAPDYLTIPHLWSFGVNGYQGRIFATEDSHKGGEQIAGGQSKGNYTWITWGTVTNGSNPKISLVRGLTTGHTATAPVLLTTETLLSNSDLTKLELSSASLGLFHTYETNRANYMQNSLSLEVAVSNTFTDTFGDTITVQGGARGIEFYESRDPYTDDPLDAPTGGVASINKNTYVTQGTYTVDLAWERSLGAQGYTIMLNNLSDNTSTFLTNVSIFNGDPASFHLSTPTTNLTLGTSYEYLIIATNFDPPRKGGTNKAAYTHITPLPPVIRSVTTNSRGEVTNLVERNEPLRVYWGTGSSQNMITGRTIQRWNITLQDKGIIVVSWDKHASGETPDYYKVYRTSTTNSPNALASDNMSSWTSPKLLGTVSGSSTTVWRDNLVASTSTALRRGSGSPYTYPMYYYRVTAVKKLANGTEIESLPSYFTNLKTGAKGAAAGGSAIDPDDVYAAPAFVNVVFDYCAHLGWGNYKVFTGAESPEGIELFGTRTRGSFNYPPNPFWVAWGLSDNASARFWVRKDLRGSRAWPGFSDLNLTDHNYSGNNKTTTYVATQENPTANRFIEFSNSGDLSGGNPVTKFYDVAARSSGAGFEVAAVNPNAKLNGLPLKGESRGMWYHQVSY